MKKITYKLMHPGVIGCTVTVLVCAVAALFFVFHTFLAGSVYFIADRHPDVSGKDVVITAKDLRRFIDLRSIDLSGCELSVAEYNEICRQDPGCVVTWDIPLGNEKYPSGSEQLVLPDINAEDSDVLKLFPDLRSVIIKASCSPELLCSLKAMLPECSIVCEAGTAEGVELSGSELKVGGTDASALADLLSAYPDVSRAVIEPCTLDHAELLALKREFPAVTFEYSFMLEGRQHSSMESDPDLAPLGAVSEAELESEIALFNAPVTVNLGECTFKPEEYAALSAAFPSTELLWTCELFGNTYSSADSVIDISRNPITPEETERILPCFPGAEKIVMCGCGIPDEEMGELNERHPEVKFVWEIELCTHKIRTDETAFIASKYFQPNRVNDNNSVVLKYLTDLEALDLGHNRLTKVEFLSYMPHLKYLILADNSITDISPVSDLKELVFFEVFKNPLTDISPVLGCTALEDLNVSGTFGDSDSMYDTLSKLTWIKRIWAGGTKLSREHVELLKEQYPYLELEIGPYGGGTDGTWRYRKNYYDMRDAFGMEYFPAYVPNENGEQP